MTDERACERMKKVVKGCRMKAQVLSPEISSCSSPSGCLLSTYRNPCSDCINAGEHFSLFCETNQPALNFSFVARRFYQTAYPDHLAQAASQIAQRTPISRRDSDKKLGLASILGAGFRVNN